MNKKIYMPPFIYCINLFIEEGITATSAEMKFRGENDAISPEVEDWNDRSESQTGWL